MRAKLSKADVKFPLRVLGPAKSGYGRLNGRHKYAVTIKCKLSDAFRRFMSELLLESSKNRSFSNVRVYADINGD